jgi:aerobic carbon-monoxide dehydrogenase large subunit
VKAVFTNTVPVDAYRGAGRPEATYLLERLIDVAAREMGIDRVEIRRRNFIPADAFPYQTPVALQYDSGNYDATLDQALEIADWAGFEARRRRRGQRQAARHRHLDLHRGLRHRAVGVVGQLGARAGLYEAGTVRVHPDRQRHGAHRHAQPRPGPRDDLRAGGRRQARHRHRARSTSCMATPPRCPFGMGTYGSRSLAVGGRRS